VPEQLASFGPYSVNVTVPVGLASPLTVATSLNDVSTGPPADATVATVGVAATIVADSFGALHGCATVAFAASPLYVAVQRYVPMAVGVNEPDVALPALNATVDVKTGVVAHVALFGP
jgi:hypothetical protein